MGTYLGPMLLGRLGTQLLRDASRQRVANFFLSSLVSWREKQQGRHFLGPLDSKERSRKPCDCHGKDPAFGRTWRTGAEELIGGMGGAEDLLYTSISLLTISQLKKLR